MSTANLPDVQAPLPDAVLEAVVAKGDVALLSPAQRVAWYRARCEAAGLDPRTQPFEYLTLKGGKIKLYATKAATDQLIASRRLTTQILDRRHDPDLAIYEVTCRVTFPDGHTVDDMAAVDVWNLKGEDLCNAVMKCVTKSKRRTVLSACGLGMLDESELETIPGAVRVETLADNLPALPSYPQNNSGHGRGQYASPEQVAEFVRATHEFVDARNAAWLDEWTGEDGQVEDGIGELLRVPQVYGHLLKWALRTGKLAQVPLTFDPETGKPTEKVSSEQTKKYLAIVYAREPESVAAEAMSYFSAQAEEARAKWTAENGEAETAAVSADDGEEWEADRE